MELLLHTPIVASNLSGFYERAFRDATELFVVSAYLTEWDSELRLNPECRSFRVIIGSDFGVTRKAACERVMRWLPPERKSQFLVADQISGFHPKAVFWREKPGVCFAIVGSSNLTRAAFDSNYEANVFSRLSESEYRRAKEWVKEIERQSIVVSEDWLMHYTEATRRGALEGKRVRSKAQNTEQLIELRLPTPRGMERLLESRRVSLSLYQRKRASLEKLFRKCANGQVSSKGFYNDLPSYWSSEVGDRMQGAGWEIKGKHSDFRALSNSFVRILDAPKDERDDVVSKEIDELSEKKVPTRGAFLSEMLSLRFPKEYPVLAEPVWHYLKTEGYKPPRNSSEGAHYIFLAKTLRASLLRNPKHPAKNLAELDTVIWLAYGKENRP
jgi:hypothetical protein